MGLFNLGKGNVRKLHEFVDIVRSDLDRSDSQRNEAMKDLIVNIDRPGGESLFTSADLTKSRGVLHFAPKIELEEGIPRFMDWYRDQWVDHKNRRENIKYLLISSFYVNRIDPLRGSNDPKKSKFVQWRHRQIHRLHWRLVLELQKSGDRFQCDGHCHHSQRIASRRN